MAFVDGAHVDRQFTWTCILLHSRMHSAMYHPSAIVEPWFVNLLMIMGWFFPRITLLNLFSISIQNINNFNTWFIVILIYLMLFACTSSLDHSGFSQIRRNRGMTYLPSIYFLYIKITVLHQFGK